MLLKWFICLLTFPVIIDAASYYVSTTGSDANPGTLASPFATIEAARTALAGGAGTIYLRVGTYFRTNSLDWTGTAYVTITRYNNESVKLVGGKQITNFVAVSGSVTARLLSAANTYQVSLTSQGVTNYGTLQRRGAPGWNPEDMPVEPAALELFFNEQPMTLAQYPNGATTWGYTTNVTGDPYTVTNFGYMDPRPTRWQNDLVDIWGYGFWMQDWADSHLQIYSMDTNAQRASIVGPMDRYGWLEHGGRFQWQNVFDELDVANEYYVDRTNGVLYFYPPSSIAAGTAYVSLLTNIVTITNGANLTFNGITFEICRGHAVNIDGATNVLFGNCTFKNIGNYAAWVTNAFNSGFTNCVVTQTGDGGFSIAGGTRTNLASGSNYVLNCEFYNLGYWDRMDHAPIKTYGVGSRIANCLFRDLPHNAIRLFGNNHLVEYCEFTNTVMQAGDAGTIYGTKDWSGRGNVIRYNYFHATYGLNQLGCSGPVYLDDGTSGTTIYGNIFYDNYATADVLVGGGRDNITTNNIFCNPKSSWGTSSEVIAYHIDGRFLPGQWANGSSNDFANMLKAMPYTDATWTAAYPHINDMLLDDPCAPMYNVFRTNIITYPWWKSINAEALPYWDANEYTTVTNFYNPISYGADLCNPGFTGTYGYGDFTNMTLMSFTLTNNAPYLLAGFQQIPVALIGRMPVNYPMSTLRNVRLKNAIIR